MKNRLLWALLLFGAVSASAQDPVKGTVTDKKGNPIPGAKVEATSTGESVLTDVDGTFSLPAPSSGKLTARFVGLQSKTAKAKDGMVIQLGRSSWLKWQPQRWQFFIAAQGAVVDDGCHFWDSFKNPSFGLTLGVMKRFGFYAKVMTSIPKDDDHNHYGTDRYWTTGNRSSEMFTAIGGLMIHTGTPLYIHAGVGYMESNVKWELSDGKYAKYKDDCYSGICFDAGLTLRLGNHFLLNGGYIYGDKKAQAPYLGVGYAF